MTQTEQFMAQIDNHREWLETTEGDEIECISIENLKAQLEKFFNEEPPF